jgi:hypothetical protein
MATSEEEDSATLAVTTSDNGLTLLTHQLATLASCRPDVLGAKKRTALIRTVQEALRSDPIARKLLAEWKGALLELSITNC